MHAKITRPAQQNHPPRFLFYGPRKQGRTALTASAGQGKVLILDPEWGTAWMKSAKSNPHVWHIEEWSEIEEFLQYVRSGKHEYTWIGIDNLTRLLKLALYFVIKRPPDSSLDRVIQPISLPRRGQANDLVITMINRLRRLPLGLIYTAGERILTNKQEVEGEKSINNHSVNGDEEDIPVVDIGTDIRYVPDLTDEVRRFIVGDVDLIGRLYATRDEEGELERRLWVAPHDAYDTGYRSLYRLPEYISRPSIPRIVTLLEKGKNNG